VTLITAKKRTLLQDLDEEVDQWQMSQSALECPKNVVHLTDLSEPPEALSCITWLCIPRTASNDSGLKISAVGAVLLVRKTSRQECQDLLAQLSFGRLACNPDNQPTPGQSSFGPSSTTSMNLQS
jgi:hypothetical protein